MSASQLPDRPPASGTGGLAGQNGSAANAAGRRPVRYSCVVIGSEGEESSAALHGLAEHGFRPFVAPSAQVAFDTLRQWHFDAALVDADGLGHAAHDEILRELRARLQAPVILLSLPQAEHEQIRSLESGATEIVTKPASARLLALKMQRLIEFGQRRDEAPERAEILLGPLAMNARLGLATIGERPLRLTAHQFHLLFLLASRAGESVDRETIAMRLRGRFESVGRSTDVQVSRIRRRLREEGVEALHVDTVHGRGYVLTLEAADDTRPRAASDRTAMERSEIDRAETERGTIEPTAIERATGEPSAFARRPGSGPVEQMARLA